jgi:hypothetical protein
MSVTFASENPDIEFGSAPEAYIEEFEYFMHRRNAAVFGLSAPRGAPSE